MKKIILTAVSALALASFADGVASTEFGVLKVPSTAEQTIVAVPWLESGTGTNTVDNAISVSNVVLTAGLTTGDTLMLYDGAQKAYTGGWKLENGAWVGKQIILDTKVIPAGTDQVKLPRGSAILLKRSVHTGGFYIMGKPSDADAEIPLPAGAYSLIAPPSVDAENGTDVNDMTWTGIEGAKDALIIPTTDGSDVFESAAYKKSTGKWVKWDKDQKKYVENVKIPAGVGAWFHNGGTADKSAKWTSKK